MKSEINKWQVNRAGLFNYWYYEDQVFDFIGGKLLLRGNNGSGKSVTMQSFLPVLLDGSTRPERLDPFGSRARKIEDYLLGEKEVTGYDERTGYLYMEFKRKETDQYITIGIGLQARRGKQLDFWGFVLTDNRRIGDDFLLYEKDIHDGEQIKIPLSKIQLRNKIAEGGQVVSTRRDYANLVNQYIFGYETSEEYEDLIKLLIQLRSPKLSKDFRPTELHEILMKALAPLSDEDLRHLSAAIDQMDLAKQQLEQIELESNALAEVTRAYTAYNEKVLYDQATGFSEATKKLEKEEKLYQKEFRETKELSALINQLEVEIQDYELEYETTEKSRQRLEQHKVWNLEQERQETQAALHKAEEHSDEMESRMTSIRSKELTTRNQLDSIETIIYQLDKEVTDHLTDLKQLAIEAGFNERHEMHEKDFVEHTDTYFSFGLWNKQTDDYMNHLDSVTEVLRKIEELKEKYAEKEKTLGQVNKHLDQLRDDERKWTDIFHEDKNHQLKAIHEWMQQAEYLEITDQTIQEISRALDLLYEKTRYEQVREPVGVVVSEYESTKNKELANNQINIEQANEEIATLDKELKEWKAKKDPDPNTHELTKKARLELADKGIEVAPLYSVVEFQEGVESETQKRIEATLIDTGLLDALITEEDISITHDRLLKPNPQLMAYTLADLLKSDVDEASGLSAEFIDQILRSIVIDESVGEALSISEEGYYSMGLMTGHAIPVESVRFVGRNARKRYREEQIQNLQREIDLKQEQIESYYEIKEQLDREIIRAKEHFKHFPNDDDLSEGYDTIKDIQRNMEQLNQQIGVLSEEVKHVGDDLRAQTTALRQHVKNDALVLDLSVYIEATKTMREYKETFSDLRVEYEKRLNQFQQKEFLSENLKEFEEEMLHWNGMLRNSEGEISRLNKELAQIKQQLEEEGVTDIQQQIKAVQEKLQKLNQEVKQMRDEYSGKKVSFEYAEHSLQEKEVQLDVWKYLKEAWEITFSNEMENTSLVLDLKEYQLEEKATEIQKMYERRSQQNIAQVLNTLSRVRNDQQDYLIEYSPVQRTVSIDRPEFLEKLQNDTYRPLVNEWDSARSRDLVELYYQGKKVSPYVVEKDLTQERERQKVYLDEQDRQLYEEILFQSVGNKLRSRITRAERWVDEMRKLMESRKDSSGLKFSIRWKPKTADTEEELDTKDLVDLLRQDPKLLKDEDIDRVTTHFRTKIERAKSMRDESTEMQTLLQVLKQVLDYRHWFTFELSFQRAGSDRKRPLTDTQFNKFSGGEKARAMYIPLFIATYSRYQEANEEAPYIISLDEAFAGVDDENIADLFEVTEELDFNYIMNSQVLWGDYATVSELGISELYRPQNADHVVVIRYGWDGKKKSLLMDNEEER